MSSSFRFLYATLLLLGFISVCCGYRSLWMDFYRKTCPGVEGAVRKITWRRVAEDPSLSAKLLRLHYHDCFVTGCDGSILLNSTSTSAAEKDARPNLSLLGYDVIEDIKTQIEEVCPRTVSCADILALVARDAVSFQFGRPLWKVPTGRRDGRTSLASEVNGNLPAASANFSTLQQIFVNKGLNMFDLVALSGAHTIGVSHCGTLNRRLFNFTGKGDTDPSLDQTYAQLLRGRCSNPPNPSNTTIDMDPRSSFSFDSNYFRIVKERKGLFQSDAALLSNPTPAKIVSLMQNDRFFFTRFAQSMIRMGAIGVLAGKDGEIRDKCSVVN